ncbi:MAG: hypothetical protein K2J32_03745 [Ruminococcus sp.]|nr:hypothetical protein [Ruminococcus sp.]
MKITDKKVANKLVPKVVKHLVTASMPKEVVKKLIKVIAQNVIKYGYQRQELITQSTIAVCQEFGDISVKFFKILNETVQMSMQLRSCRYDKIIDFIISYEDAPLSEKVELFLLIEEEKREKVQLIMEGTIAILGILTTGHVIETKVREHEQTQRDPNYNETKQTEIKEREKTERKRIKHN